MSVVELVDTIKKRKDELGFTIEKLSLESGVGACTINRIIAGEDFRYSSLESLLKSLNLSLTIGQY